MVILTVKQWYVVKTLWGHKQLNANVESQTKMFAILERKFADYKEFFYLNLKTMFTIWDQQDLYSLDSRVKLTNLLKTK